MYQNEDIALNLRNLRIYKNECISLRKYDKFIKNLHKEINKNSIEKPKYCIHNETNLNEFELEKYIDKIVETKLKSYIKLYPRPRCPHILQDQINIGAPLIILTDEEKKYCNSIKILYNKINDKYNKINDKELKGFVLIKRAMKKYSDFYNKSISDCKINDILYSSAGLNGWAAV